MVLTDDVLIEDRADLLRLGQSLLRRLGVDFLADDVVAQVDAFVADVHRRPGDELAHFVFALAAERAIQDPSVVASAACFGAHRDPEIPSISAPI
jgi:hypothetical protein